MQGLLRVTHATRGTNRADLGTGAQTSPGVEVVLSTFNGARFLCEQLESIETQSLKPRCIWVRDDGSSDDSVSLLKARHLNSAYRFLPQRRLGATRSFFALLRSTSPDLDYVAFADQDDVWKPGKLAVAIERLSRAAGPDVPALYCSRAEIVDQDLRPLGLTPLAPYHPSFANALVQNIAMGCTIVINRAARDLLCRAEPPEWAFHDWWAYLVVSAFGKVIFDPEPTILYRQHGRNLVGIQTSATHRLVAMLRRQLIGPRPLSLIEQARALHDAYGSLLAPAPRHLLIRFIEGHGSRSERIRYLRRAPIYRQSGLHTLAMKCLYFARSDF